MTEQEKKAILENIDRVPTDKLIEILKSGNISFQEMKETHKLDARKQDDLRMVVEEVELNQKREDDIWTNSQNLNSITSYEEYLSLYGSNGKYKDIAQLRLNKLREERDRAKIELLEDIKNNPEDYPPEYLKENLFGTKRLLKSDLISNGIITEQKLEIYLNPPPFLSGENQYTWENLNDIPDGNTDLYVFGIPRSGKSCILAGMLYQANKDGIIKLDVSNDIGVKYANELMRGIKLGYVPPSTSVDQVNYVSCEFDYNEMVHSLSIVEMSGEFFNRTYESNSVSEDSSIGARGFLSNDNQKVILLVIDYDKDLKGVEYSDVADQGQIFNYVLGKLEKDGTLEKTDSIQIVVTKTDLMPQDGDRTQITRDFLQENYLSTIKEIKRINKKFGINKTRDYNVVVHPFSLGKFMLGKTFEFDKTDSDKLLMSILNLTQSDREQSWTEKLFGKR